MFSVGKKITTIKKHHLLRRRVTRFGTVKGGGHARSKNKTTPSLEAAKQVSK